MRKSIVRKRGKSFTAAGIGRHGPYAVHTHRVGRGVYAKASVGTRGITTGLKCSGRRHSVEVGYNHATGSPYVGVKKRSRRKK